MKRLERAPFQANRRTVDVSGDGTNNSGRDVTSARDDAVAQGVTINGLVILSEPPPLTWNADHTNPPGGLEAYYRNNVVGGPNSFVMVAENFQAFSQAILKKLVAEVAAASLGEHGRRAVKMGPRTPSASLAVVSTNRDRRASSSAPRRHRGGR
jgi:hypothetical protein